MANKQSYVYELELFYPACKTYYTHVGVAKLMLWATYMKDVPETVEQIQKDWFQLRDEWSISGIGEIRPIIPTEGLTYCDLGI